MQRSVKDLSLVVKRFLDQMWDGTSPLLVAYSGGFDSKALLYATLEWGKTDIHIAHADHGWREESAHESDLLKEEAQRLGVPFHLGRLKKSHSENEARTLRYAFFHSLKKEVPYQAVLVGHQANDLAETVLKRVFEGAHLTNLVGMRPCSSLGELDLWRPLLFTPRSIVEEWLFNKKLTPLDDPSNADPRFLRSRMRSELLPFLSKSFGKNILPNLLQLSERSTELSEYLFVKNQDKIKEHHWGVSVDGEDLHRIELRYLLLEVLKRHEMVLPRTVVELVLDRVSLKSVHFRPVKRVLVHRGLVFVLKKDFQQITVSELKNAFFCRC